jgi:hypothetical protein
VTAVALAVPEMTDGVAETLAHPASAESVPQQKSTAEVEDPLGVMDALSVALSAVTNVAAFVVTSGAADVVVND